MEFIGAYEAKTHLPRLLDRVARGSEFTITKHGVPVARLVPAVNGRKPAICDTIAQLKAFRQGRTLRGVSIRTLFEAGRA